VVNVRSVVQRRACQRSVLHAKNVIEKIRLSGQRCCDEANKGQVLSECSDRERGANRQPTSGRKSFIIAVPIDGQATSHPTRRCDYQTEHCNSAGFGISASVSFLA
jgi:hypothetical protein